MLALEAHRRVGVSTRMSGIRFLAAACGAASTLRGRNKAALVKDMEATN